MTVSQCLEAMLALHLAAEDDITDEALASFNMINLLKALRWMVKITQIPFPDLYHPPISSWSFSDHQHKESISLPLYFLIAWEWDILNEVGSLHDRLFKGSVLFEIWASLRFSDCQRVDWNFFAVDNSAFTASAYRTKTSRNGTPFGISWKSFLADHDHIATSCLYHWLALMDIVLSHTTYGSSLPDFVFCDLAPKPDFKILGPLSYHQALRNLRGIIASSAPDPWSKIVDIKSFTLHSMKCTFLSFAAQLQQTDASRAAQGHHAHGSIHLYARDDVTPAILLQEEISSRAREGWRPQIPQHRGAQSPQADIPLKFEPFHQRCVHVFAQLPCMIRFSAASNHPVMLFQKVPEPVSNEAFARTPPLSPLQDDVLHEVRQDPAAEPGDQPGIKFVSSSHVSHVATPSTLGYKAKCGAIMSDQAQLTLGIPERNRMCLRKACLSTFEHYA